MGVRDRLNQQTVIGLAFYDGRSGFAALQDSFPRVEPQAAHLGLPMAGPAVLCQNRPDLHLEVMASVLSSRSCSDEKR